MNDESVLREARFDPKVKVYWYVQGLLWNLFLVSVVVGVVTTPLWLVGGWWVVARRYETLSASLTERAVHLRKGYINRVEKTVPLEKIQDLGLRSGPILRAFGLASIHIETAGSSGQGAADLLLTGVEEPEAFRDAVLGQRDAVTGGRGVQSPSAPASDEGLLTEIRDSLYRIETLLADRS